jgi:hypothetical protein
MKRAVYLPTFAAAVLTALLSARAPAPAQVPPVLPKPNGPGPVQKSVPTVAVAFRNDLDKPIIVQGFSVVNGFQRRGQPIPVPAGKVNFDNNVPIGVRFITVFDGTQPSRVLARNVRIPVEPGRELRVLIRFAPNNPDQILVVPDNGK